jgi:hypothetical protein
MIALRDAFVTSRERLRTAPAASRPPAATLVRPEATAFRAHLA